MTTQKFVTIKEAALLCDKSEVTIRRVVKQYKSTQFVKTMATPKGEAYLISYNFLKGLYETLENEVVISDTEGIDQLKQEIYQLKEQLLEKDKTLQQLKDQSTEKDKTIHQQQNQLFEQRDMLNALTNQLNSQKINRIEELLLQQQTQLADLQNRMPSQESIEPVNEPVKKSLWQRIFG
jgi:chromosome segregation ATPase